MPMKDNRAAFLIVAKKLNQLQLTPLLMGSVGLEYLTKTNWQSKDIDIHVPGDPRGWAAPGECLTDWHKIVSAMALLDYQLIDSHEHQFVKAPYSVGFGVIQTLPPFADVAISELVPHHLNGVDFLLPTLADYLKIYHASSKDSYRAERNNHKDFAKIAYLTKLLGQ